MKRRVVVANVLAGLATLAALAIHARHQNRAALANASGLCASAALRSRLEHALEHSMAGIDVVPRRLDSQDLRYTFDGFGAYSASCVISQSQGLVMMTSVTESR